MNVKKWGLIGLLTFNGIVCAEPTSNVKWMNEKGYSIEKTVSSKTNKDEVSVTVTYDFHKNEQRPNANLRYITYTTFKNTSWVRSHFKFEDNGADGKIEKLYANIQNTFSMKPVPDLEAKPIDPTHFEVFRMLKVELGVEQVHRQWIEKYSKGDKK